MSTDVIEQQQDQLRTVNDPANLVLDQGAMKHMMEVATFMSGGTLTLPEPYRKNPANCLAVVMQAAQWNMNPFAVAQKTHFVNGTIGYEAQLVAAVINDSKAVKDTFHFDWFGDWDKILGKFEERESKTKKDDNGYAKKYKVPGWKFTDEEGLGVKVWATLRGEDEPRELSLLMTQANVRNSTLWADDPRQQLAYLAQKRWARLYAPGVILGVYTKDELEDVEPRELNEAPAGSTAPAKKGKTIDPKEEERRTGLIKQLETAAEQGTTAFLGAWKAMGKANRNDAYLVGESEYARLQKIAVAVDDATPESQPENPAEAQETAEHAEAGSTVKDSFVAEMEAAERQ